MSIEKRHVILILILVLASLLRLAPLGSRSFWGDEVDSIFVSYDLGSEGFERRCPLTAASFSLSESLKDGSKMPLYYVLLGLWIDAFGPGEITVRMLSVVFALLSIILFYMFASGVLGERGALLSTFLLSISPMHLLYSHEVRPYSLMFLFAVCSTMFLFRVLKGEGGGKSFALYFISTLLMAYCHFHAVLFLAAQGVMALYRKRVKLLAAQFGILVLYLAWAAYGIMKWGKHLLNPELTSPFPTYNFIVRTAWTAFSYMFGESMAPWNPVVIIGLIGYAAAAAALIAGLRSEKDQVKTAFALILVFMVISMFMKYTLPNYLITGLPLFLVLVVSGIERCRKDWIRFLIVAAISAACLVSIDNYFRLDEMHNSNRMEPWREIAYDISQSLRPGDTIAMDNRFVVFRELNYYMNVLGEGRVDLQFLRDGVNSERVFLVLSIFDEDRKEMLHSGLKKDGYSEVSMRSYVPYAETLASRLPQKHHRLDQSRVEVYLYERD